MTLGRHITAAWEILDTRKKEKKAQIFGSRMLQKYNTSAKVCLFFLKDSFISSFLGICKKKERTISSNQAEKQHDRPKTK